MGRSRPRAGKNFVAVAGGARPFAHVRVPASVGRDPLASSRTVRETCTANPPLEAPSPKRTRFYGSAM
ncbi:hypothetical protein [Haloferax sp. ATB1]|uniref:hypothetical protein n=1 Tax=Haloferax sp. ATB1 TaxID=1508454 RepID=UPI000AB786AA|nr:hypothetical protein [Haloferax sp. ATB1]